MSNTVYEVDYTRALPAPLRYDENMLALGKVIAGELQENIRLSRLNIIYARIDELDESLLDLLAHDLHVEWYDPDSPPDIKRAILKGSVKVHKRMGTKYAVESVVSAYFGSGEVREWYEYGGEPHHFKIISDNPSVTDERAAQFFRILDIVKRKSSWLDTILITLTGESFVHAGVLLQEFTREAHIIAPQDFIDQYLTLNVKEVYAERTKEKHRMGTQDGMSLYFKALLYERTAERNAIGSGEITAQHGALLYERTTEQHIFKEE